MFTQATNLKAFAAAGVIAVAATAGCGVSPATDLLTYKTKSDGAHTQTKKSETFTGSTAACVTFGMGDAQYVVAFPVGSEWEDSAVVLPDGKKVEMGEPVTFTGGEFTHESIAGLNEVANCATEGKKVWGFQSLDA